MKKTVFWGLLAIVALEINPAHSEPTCYDGTLIYASGHPEAGAARNALCAPEPDRCNDHVFCRSNISTNWFSAWTWCKSQGRRLARWEIMCPGGSNAEGVCPNLQSAPGTSAMWSSYSFKGNDQARTLIPTSGQVSSGRRSATTMALCE